MEKQNKAFQDILKDLESLAKISKEDYISHNDLDKIELEITNLKKNVHKYLTAIKRKFNDRLITNRTIKGKLLGLAEVTFYNAETSGQEGDIYLYDYLMGEYNIIMSYIDTGDTNLKDKVYNMYRQMFGEDIDILPDTVALVGTSLKECLHEDINSPVYLEYTKTLYKVLKGYVLNDKIYKFIVDLTEETSVLIVLALINLRNRYKDLNIEIIGIKETDYLNLFLPKDYRQLYFDCLEKLDSIIYIDEINTKSMTSWYRKSELERYLTSSKIFECIVFADEVPSTLKDRGHSRGCKVSRYHINILVNNSNCCTDCKCKLQDGLDDTVYCEECGRAMCIDCGKLNSFKCSRCR